MNDHLNSILNKILLPDHLVSWRDGINNKKIIFTNGVFDILHRGHATYLAEARSLGDILVVAINDNDSVRRLKGKDRPINDLEDRLLLLATLTVVDFVTYFGESTPLETIRKVRPHVHVKGGDYQVEDLPETPILQEMGARVEVLPFVAGYSTTGIVERLKGSR